MTCRSVAFTTAATFAIMFSVSLALVVLWTQSPSLALVLVGPLVAVALHQRATHNALRAMRLALARVFRRFFLPYQPNPS